MAVLFSGPPVRPGLIAWFMPNQGVPGPATEAVGPSRTVHDLWSVIGIACLLLSAVFGWSEVWVYSELLCPPPQLSDCWICLVFQLRWQMCRSLIVPGLVCLMFSCINDAWLRLYLLSFWMLLPSSSFVRSKVASVRGGRLGNRLAGRPPNLKL